MKNFKKYSLAGDHSGASIIIAVALIAVIVFFTIGIASTMMMTLQNTSNAKKALQAEYAAQSGVELSLLGLSKIDPAFGGVWPVITGGGTYPVSDLVTAGYNVFGQDKETVYSGSGINANYRTIPTKGNGNAGVGCVKKTPSTSVATTDVCSWNKIYYGESVDIPLYVVTLDGDEVDGNEVVTNPGNTYTPTAADPTPKFVAVGLGTTNFYLNIRAPCKTWNGATCTTWYNPAGPTSGEGDGELILSWQINGDCFKDGAFLPCSVSQILNSNSSVQEHNLDFGIGTGTGSGPGVMYIDFFANNLDPDIAFNAIDLNSVRGFAGNFLMGTGSWIGSYLNKPVLKLSFISDIKSETNEIIPYLEYQIKYKNTNGNPLKAFASSYLIEVEGNSDSFRYSVTGVRDMRSGLFDFAVQN